MNQGIDGSIKAVMAEVLKSGLLSSLCTITVPPHVYDAGGAPDPAAPYLPLAMHQNIPCTDPPLSIGDTPAASELKDLAEIMAKNSLHVLLGGFYPAIIPDYRALIAPKSNPSATVEYDIVGVESDSQNTQTRLAVQRVTI